MREQRQRAGLGGDVAQDQLDEAGLELQPGEPGRLGDRALELGGAHRPEQHLVVGDGERELAVPAEPAVDVGAYSDRDGAAQPQQRVDERPSAIRVVTQREQLLELVDDDESIGLVVGVERGRGPRRQRARRAAARRPRRRARRRRRRRAERRTCRCPMRRRRRAAGRARAAR